MPSLIIIAGPNGAGKSTVSYNLLKPFGIAAFDYDKIYFDQWAKFDYDPIIQEGIRKSTMERFYEHLKDGFVNKKHVAFETNFNSELTLTHVVSAKKSGFTSELIFIGLQSPDLAIKRVANRVKEGGHPVSASTIRERYDHGLKLLDENYHLFDRVFIYESLPEFTPLVECILIDDSGIQQLTKPSFMHHLPNLQLALNR